MNKTHVKSPTFFFIWNAVKLFQWHYFSVTGRVLVCTENTS